MSIPIRAALAALAAACLAGPAASADDDLTVDAAIVFVMDVSASIAPSEQRFAREAHAFALTSPLFLEGVAQGVHRRVAAAYVEFGRLAWPVVGWTVIAGPEDADAFAASILAAPDMRDEGSTAIGEGLAEAVAMLAALPWPAEKLVVDVVGDGRSYMGRPVAEPRAQLIAMGAAINALPLMTATAEADLDVYYRTEVSGIAGFCLPLISMDQLPMALRDKLLMELF